MNPVSAAAGGRAHTARGVRQPLAVPPAMLAAAVDRFGGPTELTIHRLAVPKIGPHEVLIALHAAGVGPWDVGIRAGRIVEAKPAFPLVLGTDGAGIVVAAGARVRRLKVGDEVYSYSWNNPKGGFYAEYVAVAADKVARIPKRIDLTQAGAMATIALTALQGIDDALQLRRGETIIIHGASGGVGMLAVQFAKLRRGRVLATASGRDGMALARDLGADAVVDGHRGDIAEAAHGLAPDGVDAVLALAGGAQLDRCLDAMKREGRVAYPSGVEPRPVKRRGMTVIRYDAVAGVRELERLNRAVEEARLKVPIAREFPLRHAARAHERLAKGHVVGKIVLRVDSLKRS
jgi:NADPH:quinone reductase